MTRKKIVGRLVVVLLSMILVVCSMNFTGAHAYAAEAGNADLRAGAEGEVKAKAEADYAPGEVIVMFKDGAVKDIDMSLKSARALPAVGSGYGMSLNASDSADEAADAAKSEAAILKESLGSSFVLEDSLVFPAADGAADTEAQRAADTEADGAAQRAAEGGEGGKIRLDSEGNVKGDDEGGILNIALVKSDRYDTETLIRKLSANSKVAAAEPNYYMHFNEYDDYALNDAYSSYLYHVNSPEAKNTAGASVDTRGEMPEDVERSVSINAASGWKKLSGDEQESVVAVVDTGLNVDHEDLVSMLWNNDTDVTGLKGEHGYNFGDDNTDLTDHIGHGTHCCGIIAAQAGNGIGVTGITGKANVKIMMCKIFSDTNATKLYTCMGAFNYVLRAKKAGVNVVATSNSYGRTDISSETFEEIIDRMGKEGILTFTAAGNSRTNLDTSVFNPPSNESDFSIAVGAAGINGEACGFSNYGKSQVDLFAPGLNILSTVGITSYFPSLYTAEELSRTTEYYGGFDKSVKINWDGTVTPSKGLGDSSVKKFGKSRFRAVEDPSKLPDEMEGDGFRTNAKCKLEIVPDHYFTTGENAASLKVTIKNAMYGEMYYLYFPYKKNSHTTGDDNTMLSIYYENGENLNSSEAQVMCGEIVENADGTLFLTGHGTGGHALSGNNNYVGTHIYAPKTGGAPNQIMSYDELDRRKVGVGLCIRPSRTIQGANAWSDGKPHDLEFYIDSIAVSRPGAKIDRNSSYDMMSGTSMACPAAAGAGALIAAIEPRRPDEQGDAYALRIKNKLFSCVRKDDEFKDLCATGGFIDLTLLDDNAPVISDAVVDSSKGTVTLRGSGLKEGIRITYRKTKQKYSQEVTLPASGMTVKYSEDGSEAVINNAGDLIGSFVEFSAIDGDKSGKYTFFLVKGEKKMEFLSSYLNPNATESNYAADFQNDRYIFADEDGDQLYGIEKYTGVVSRFDGEQFVDIPGTKGEDMLKKVLADDLGFDDYQLKNDFTFEFWVNDPVLKSGNKIYIGAKVTNAMGPISDKNGQTSISKEYLLQMDISEKKPRWNFLPGTGIPAIEGETNLLIQQHMVGDVIYALTPLEHSDVTALFSYNINKPEDGWKREQDLPQKLTYATRASYKGKLYIFFGTRAMNSGKYEDESILDDVWCFDGEKWEKTGTLKFAGKYSSRSGVTAQFLKMPVEVADGLIFVDCAVDGLGNSFLYDPEKDKAVPLHYTINSSASNDTRYGICSTAVTRDGLYYMRDVRDETRYGWAVYRIPFSSGAYDPLLPMLNKTQLSLKAGQEVKLSVSHGVVKKWQSSNSKIVKVKNGLLTALKKGNTVITATLTTGKKLKCSVAVTTSPELSKSTATVKRGKTTKVKIKGKADSVDNLYKNTSIAKVTSKKTASTLKIKGLKKGSTTLKIRVNGKWLKLKVKVK